MKRLIHRGRPTVTAGGDHYFRTWCTSVRPSHQFQNLAKQNNFQVSNSDRYWRDCGSGQVDNWWHTCLVFKWLLIHIHYLNSSTNQFLEAQARCTGCIIFLWDMSAHLNVCSHASLQRRQQKALLACFLIHEANPQSRLVVSIVFALVVCLSVCPHFPKSSKTKQISNENKYSLLERLWV